MNSAIVFADTTGKALGTWVSRGRQAEPDVLTTEALDDYESKVWASVAPKPSGFTAEKAAKSATAASPSVVLAEAEVEVAIAKTRQTLSRYVPNVTITGSVSRKNLTEFNFGSGASVGALNEGPLTVGMCLGGAAANCVLDSQGSPVAAIAAQPFETPRNTYSVDATLSVPFSDYVLALWPTRKGADANERAARLRQEAEVQTADVNARIAYFDWVRANAQVAIAEASRESSTARVADAKMGLDAGTITSADALGLESLAAAAELSVMQAKSFLRLAEQNLRITAQYNGPLEIGEDLSANPGSMSDLGSLESLKLKLSSADPSWGSTTTIGGGLRKIRSDCATDQLGSQYGHDMALKLTYYFGVCLGLGESDFGSLEAYLRPGRGSQLLIVARVKIDDKSLVPHAGLRCLSSWPPALTSPDGRPMHCEELPIGETLTPVSSWHILLAPAHLLPTNSQVHIYCIATNAVHIPPWV